MDQARQFIRWSVPGAVFLAAGIAFTKVRGDTLDLEGGLFALVAMTVAGGFLLYQVYFFLFDGGLPTSTVPADRGAQILSVLPQKPLCDYLNVLHGGGGMYAPGGEHVTWLSPPRREAALPGRLRDRFPQFELIRLPDGMSRREYRHLRRRHFNMVASLLDNISLVEGQSCAYRQEYTALSDIAHALGASRLAITLAWGVFALMIPLGDVVSALDLVSFAIEFLAMIVNTLIAAALWWVCSKNRSQAWDKANEEMAFGLSWYLMRRGQSLSGRRSAGKRAATISG